MATINFPHSNPQSAASLDVRFWGVRGSHPVPGRTTLRYGGNTSSLQITARKGDQAHTILLDAGTGIIPLGRELAREAREAGRPVDATLLFSHLHHDHTQGLPFFAPLFNPASRLTMVAPEIFDQDAVATLQDTMAAPKFPIAFDQTAAVKVLYGLRPTGGVEIGAEGVRIIPQLPAETRPGRVRIRAHRSFAHPQSVLIYRIDWEGLSVVYATDTEGYIDGDRRLVNFARGADLLIHDAQYVPEHYVGERAGFPSTQGFGHSTPQMAASVAKAAGVGRLALFHFDPAYDDEMVAAVEAQAQAEFPNAIAAHEGLSIQLNSLQPVRGGHARPRPQPAQGL